MTKKLLLTGLLLLLLTVSCRAAEPLPDQAESAIETLQEALPREAEALLPPSEFGRMDFFQSITSMLQKLWQILRSAWKEQLQAVLLALLVICFCQMMTLIGQTSSGPLPAMTQVFGVMVCCGPLLADSINLTQAALDEMAAFSASMLPVIAATALSSGCPAGAASTYSLSVLFLQLLNWFSSAAILPMLLGNLSLSVVHNSLREKRLERLCRLFSQAIAVGLRAIVYSFTGILAITNAISGSQDAAALKAVRLSLSTAIPVVGQILSGAAETVLSGAAVLKASVGSFGMLAVLAISLRPFFRLGFLYFLLKLLSAAAGMLGSTAEKQAEVLSGCVGDLMAVIAVCVYLNLLSCVCLIRMVQG